MLGRRQAETKKTVTDPNEMPINGNPLCLPIVLPVIASLTWK